MIPQRNTIRSAATKSKFDLSYINTPSGAVIEGSVRKYDTYKDMMNDPQPTRLASVRNASLDTDYTVPDEHKGGVLYQRDFINNTWILLYTTTDLAVPVSVDWSNITNIPKWVGGVSCNRVRLIKNTYAEPRTTYYSYGDYILIFPDPNTVELGDQIVLEQYKGNGAICIPYTSDEPSTLERTTIVDTDSTSETGDLYHVVYTYADYEYTRVEYQLSEDVSFLHGKAYYKRYGAGTATDPYRYLQDTTVVKGAALPVPNTTYYEKISGPMVIDETNPINHNSFAYICTENELGGRVWRPISDDDIETTVIALRREACDHIKRLDPHHQYIRKSEVGAYIKEIINNPYVLPEASTFALGGVYIAQMQDVVSGNDGVKAVTAQILHDRLSSYALATHTHDVEQLNNVEGVAAIGNYLVYNGSKWTPVSTVPEYIAYGPATYVSSGLVILGTPADLITGSDTNKVFNAAALVSVLSGYQKTTDHDSFVNLTDVDISSLINGKYLSVSNNKIVQVDLPTATIETAGIIQIASSGDIVSGTTVTDKAVNPKHLIDVSSSIMSQVSSAIEHGGYVLPGATTLAIGGVQLITSEQLESGLSSGATFTDSAVANTNQFVSTIVSVSSSIISALSSNVARIDSSVSGLDAAVSSNYTEMSNSLSSSVSQLNSMITSKCDVLSSSVNDNLFADAIPIGATVEYNGGDILPTSEYHWHECNGGILSVCNADEEWHEINEFAFRSPATCSSISALVNYVCTTTASYISTPRYIEKYPNSAVVPISDISSGTYTKAVERGITKWKYDSEKASSMACVLSGYDGYISCNKVTMIDSAEIISCVISAYSLTSTCTNTESGVSWSISSSVVSLSRITSSDMTSLSGLSAYIDRSAVVVLGAKDHSVSPGASGWILVDDTYLLCIVCS